MMQPQELGENVSSYISVNILPQQLVSPLCIIIIASPLSHSSVMEECVQSLRRRRAENDCSQLNTHYQ